MVKRIAFFSAGFAYNRLIRLKFYEKIFPKDIEMFLITTNRYTGKEKTNYQQQYSGLKRTKIVEMKYGLSLPFDIRRFCKDNNIDRIFNLGFHNSALMLLIATLGTKTEMALNILTEVFNQYRLAETVKDFITELVNLALVFPMVWLSDIVIFNDQLNYNEAKKIFHLSKNKIYLLAAPVNTSLFMIGDKKQARKKLKLPLNKKIVIFVGRISYLKCSDILKDLILNNKDIQFILIGRMMDEEIKNLKVKNVTYFEKKSSQELIDYYNASDISFNMTRSGGGLGLTTAEALSCGVPVIIPNGFGLPKGLAVYQVSYDSNYVKKIVEDFFKLSINQRKSLRKEARKYAEEKYSDNAWKDRYIKTYLH